MAEVSARWDTPPKYYNTKTRPLADFRYLWESPYFDLSKPVTQGKITKRKEWEKILPTLTQIQHGEILEIQEVYNHVLAHGLINPLPCIEQDGVLYPVKGNQRLCVLRAIKNLIDHRSKPGRKDPADWAATLTQAQQQWVKKEFIGIRHLETHIGSFDLDAIPCRIADYMEHPGDWTHDHPVARNHIGDEIKL